MQCIAVIDVLARYRFHQLAKKKRVIESFLCTHFRNFECNSVIRLIFAFIKHLYLYCNVSVHPRHSRRHIKKSITASIYYDTPLRRPSFLADAVSDFRDQIAIRNWFTEVSWRPTTTVNLLQLQNQLVDPPP